MPVSEGSSRAAPQITDWRTEKIESPGQLFAQQERDCLLRSIYQDVPSIRKDMSCQMRQDLSHSYGYFGNITDVVVRST